MGAVLLAGQFPSPSLGAPRPLRRSPCPVALSVRGAGASGSAALRRGCHLPHGTPSCSAGTLSGGQLQGLGRCVPKVAPECLSVAGTASREAHPVLRSCGLPGRGLHWVRPDEGLSLATFLLSPGVLPGVHGPEATGSSSLTPALSTWALVPVGGLLPAPEEEGAVGLGAVLTHWAGLLGWG